MAIEQHPIPQDVACYKFRLIGEMTIKQFAFLASGIILGLIIYSLPLPFFFKYPLAAIAVGLGAGIAFLPVEGRPMDKWLIAFIKSIYSPTEYVWQKQEGGEVITAAKAPTPPVSPTPQVAPSPTVTPSSTTPTTPVSPAPPAPAVSPVAPVSTPTAPTSTETKVSIPAPTPVTITPPKPVAPPVAPVQAPAPTPVPTPPTPKPTPTTPTTPAPAAVNLPVPFTPTTPNTLVGMTLTPDGKILDGALIEIRSKGLSLRATKSNQLGQFLFAKPLENGLYQIVTEKPGFTFDTYSIDLRGQIIKPLKLQAKAHV